MLIRLSRTWLIGLGCVPLLYLLHLLLLEVYSHLLFNPRYADYASPFRHGVHFPDDPNFDPYAPPPPPPPPPPPGSLDMALPPPYFDAESGAMPPPPPPQGGSHSGMGSTPVEQRPVGPYAPPTDPRRASDVMDTFQSYRYGSECGISSLDLHLPFEPLCDSKSAMLDAISGGGRAGFDKPFIPLNCDMRWYATDEVCEIMSRFRAVVFIGDSLMRHIFESMYVYLRADIGYGAIADWAWEAKPESDVTVKEDCRCGNQTAKHECSKLAIEDSEWLAVNASSDGSHIDGSSSGLACPARLNGKPTARLHYILSNRWEAGEQEVGLIDEAVALSEEDTQRPIAFVMHSTFWNGVNVSETKLWVQQMHERITSLMPNKSQRPELFVTANAGGMNKIHRFLGTQNNQEIGNLERDIEPALREHGIDMLGCYNMSLQATSSDGTHAAFEGNLLKGMSVLNWLDWVGSSSAASSVV